MTPNEYLEAILRAQTLAPNGNELKDLESQREHVIKAINRTLGQANPEVRFGGSKAKGTMIREAYDLDLPTYFAFDENGAGDSLEDIYNNVADAMSADYFVEKRRSALRLRRRDPQRYREDTHIDLVPGRFFDESRTDAWIYQNQAEKCRLKTNLDIHIGHIRDSSLRSIIRLAKLWNVRENVRMKTFVLELLVIKELTHRNASQLSEQFTYIMERFRDNSDSLSVTDPANGNNDLTPALTHVKPRLVAAATNVLWRIGHQGWESVFGPVQEENRVSTIGRAAAAVATGHRYKPYGGG